jgi:ABC-type amino acid transport substrate-binding protein
MYRITLSVILMSLTYLAFREYRHKPLRDDGTWARIQQTGVLRVGTDGSYPPFADARETGIPVGLDIDIAEEIGRRLGVRLQIVNMGFDGLYDSLTTNQIDMLIAALSIDYMRPVIYTRPYIDAGQVIVSDQIYSMPDMEGRTIAVEYGSIGDEVARRWERRLRVLNITRTTTTDAALDAVRMGEADAALVDYVSARLYMSATNAPLMINPQSVQADQYAVAVRLSSPELAGVINAVLEDMAQDGTLATILDRWL